MPTMFFSFIPARNSLWARDCLCLSQFANNYLITKLLVFNLITNIECVFSQHRHLQFCKQREKKHEKSIYLHCSFLINGMYRFRIDVSLLHLISYGKSISSFGILRFPIFLLLLVLFEKQRKLNWKLKHIQANQMQEWIANFHFICILRSVKPKGNNILKQVVNAEMTQKKYYKLNSRSLSFTWSRHFSPFSHWFHK